MRGEADAVVVEAVNATGCTSGRRVVSCAQACDAQHMGIVQVEVPIEPTFSWARVGLVVVEAVEIVLVSKSNCDLGYVPSRVVCGVCRENLTFVDYSGYHSLNRDVEEVAW